MENVDLKKESNNANTLLCAVADHLTDYLNCKDYKLEQDEDMDKVIKLLDIKFDYDVYWYDGNCT